MLTLCFGGCLGISHLKFWNILRYKKVVRSFNVQRECFWEHGLWLFQLRESSGAKSLWRSAEIVRFEIPWKVDGYCTFQKHVNSEVQKPPSQLLHFLLPPIIIMITSNESWNRKTHKRHQSPPIKNHKPWPLEPFEIKHLFPERSAKMIDSSEKCKRHLAFELQNLCVFEKRSNITLHFWKLMVKYNVFWRLTVNPIKLSTIVRERGWAKVLL